MRRHSMFKSIMQCNQCRKLVKFQRYIEDFFRYEENLTRIRMLLNSDSNGQKRILFWLYYKPAFLFRAYVFDLTRCF